MNCSDVRWLTASYCVATIRFSRVEIDICPFFVRIEVCSAIFIVSCQTIGSERLVKRFDERLTFRPGMVHGASIYQYTWYIVLFCCHDVQFALYTICTLCACKHYRLIGYTPVRVTDDGPFILWRFGLTSSPFDLDAVVRHISNQT